MNAVENHFLNHEDTTNNQYSMYETFEKLMKANGYTAYKVSVETGIAQSTLSDWKKGKSAPKQDKIIKIAKYFNVPVESLIEGNDIKINTFCNNETANKISKFISEHPEYKTLFESVMKIEKEDIPFIKEIIDRMNQTQK